MSLPHPIIIAGPCAVESEEQMEIAIREGKKRSVTFLRTNLWKPRTKPGFDGLGKKGFPILQKVAQAGLNPGLEVITPEQAQQVLDVVLPHLGTDGKVLLWIGARNQNHLVQREIARIAASDPRVYMMVKNQPWINEDHWVGIIEHVLAAGLPKERLLNCDRGFAPGNDTNPLELRNIPDFAMTKRVKKQTDVPVVFDPSHTGGTVKNVFKMAEAAAKENSSDGIIVEVHHDPANALTDQKQQITWEQFDQLIGEIT